MEKSSGLLSSPLGGVDPAGHPLMVTGDPFELSNSAC